MAKGNPAVLVSHEENPDPFGPKENHDNPPFIVNGKNPVTDKTLDVHERLDWLTKQHEAMHAQ